MGSGRFTTTEREVVLAAHRVGGRMCGRREGGKRGKIADTDRLSLWGKTVRAGW